MNQQKLIDTFPDLAQHMQDDGYPYSYIRRLKTEVNWIAKNGIQKNIRSYEDACQLRENGTQSNEMKRWYRLAYGVLKRFEVYGQYPDGRRKESLVKRGAYHHLNPAFQNIIDLYKKTDAGRGLKNQTITGNASGGSCFLLTMQERGCRSLDDITEEDAMSFFTDSSGTASLSSSYKKEVAAVLQSDLGIYTEPARRILAYLPAIRPRRKNIPYLKPEEADAIRAALDDENSRLTLRDRAAGFLLFFTGIRGCDIIHMEFSDIDWEKDEIRLSQQKTGGGLVLPLTAAIGNAIYDYITMERPSSNDPHIFLSRLKPYDPLKPRSAWQMASKVYKAACIRQGKGERRGTHLFRYHLVSAFSENGIARPIISDTLGHADPSSLDSYLSADIDHLRECALSIEEFPVSGEVFQL